MSEEATKRNYKATFILDTRNYKEAVETLVERMTKSVEASEGEVKSVKNMGQIDFARVTDKKFPAGIYVEISFEGTANSPATLKEKLKLDRHVNRILVEAA